MIRGTCQSRKIGSFYGDTSRLSPGFPLRAATQRIERGSSHDFRRFCSEGLAAEQLVILCAGRDGTDSDRHDGEYGWEIRARVDGKLPAGKNSQVQIRRLGTRRAGRMPAIQQNQWPAGWRRRKLVKGAATLLRAGGKYRTAPGPHPGKDFGVSGGGRGLRQGWRGRRREWRLPGRRPTRPCGWRRRWSRREKSRGGRGARERR